MTKVFDARRGCRFAGRDILFDTNVWIYINGAPVRDWTEVYSGFYDDALKAGNRVVINDYIVSEFFNRLCRIQYDTFYADRLNKPSFKEARSSQEFRESVEGVRDLCLDMLKDCSCDVTISRGDKVREFVNEAAAGKLDLTDIAIREHCKERGYVFVSHDGDFADCGLELVTANRRLLAATRGRA